MFVLLASACQIKTSKNQIEKNDSKMNDSHVKFDESVQITQPTKESTYTLLKQKRFGFILTAGGARTWAYLPFLKELQINKVPVAGIAGIEWGAVIAGLYAHSGSSNEVEWELSKFKKLEEWPYFLNTVLEKKSSSSNKIPFICPSLNTKNQTAYVLNQGKTIDMVSLCLPSMGLVSNYANSIAYVTELYSLAEYLRKSGADKIVLVNVLGGSSDEPIRSTSVSETIYWASAAATYNNKRNTFIDDWITINVNGYKINDFENRKNIILESELKIKTSIKQFLTKYSL